MASFSLDQTEIRACYQALSKQLEQEISELEPALIDIRRTLHKNPEVSGEEKQTSQFICKTLRDDGLTPQLMQNDIGVIADVTLGTPAPDAPLIAIRADIDALRITDQKEVDYCSHNPGVGHLCGHDAHTSIALGAALGSRRFTEIFESEWPGQGLRLRFIFQPAEEICMGARWMVEQGAMENVAAIIGLHMDPEIAAGTANIRYGVMTAFCDEVHFEIHGLGAHAARPHHGNDPITTAAQLISSLYQNLPRSIDSRMPAVFTIGQITSGQAPNVIPEIAVLKGSLRSTNDHARDVLHRRIDDIAEGIAKSTGTRIETLFKSPLPAVVNDTTISAALEQASRDVLGSEQVGLIDQPSMGGEDFSIYLQTTPGSMLRLGCAKPGQKTAFLHSPYFDIDERALALGSRILLQTALLLSLNPQLIKKGS
ncbi:M20 metallopeptidase family protein [Gimesia fumaroli]|uniref:Putative hydrolase YxeP n=1 Tax=Gimesia fumaroli TaxID=2527976 RepID=A0A518I719_9PLAN|nr:amidohydrolase [Gimesia fumaroli]QDV48869.1 putative hydrolase YxeP [Gimesia fumaroli]